ncbi:titin-like [Cydia amplana]|uniref:titin-like n=1 Tax=Cydia amplana TaxID=1869771 RepID=UPI002FE540A4
MKILLDASSIYQVKDDSSGVSFVNPKEDKWTLRDILYYHIIERPREKPAVTERSFTNSHGYQFFDLAPLLEDSYDNHDDDDDGSYVEQADGEDQAEDIENHEERLRIRYLLLSRILLSEQSWPLGSLYGFFRYFPPSFSIFCIPHEPELTTTQKPLTDQDVKEAVPETSLNRRKRQAEMESAPDAPSYTSDVDSKAAYIQPNTYGMNLNGDQGYVWNNLNNSPTYYELGSSNGKRNEGSSGPQSQENSPPSSENAYIPLAIPNESESSEDIYIITNRPSAQPLETVPETNPELSNESPEPINENPGPINDNLGPINDNPELINENPESSDSEAYYPVEPIIGDDNSNLKPENEGFTNGPYENPEPIPVQPGTAEPSVPQPEAIEYPISENTVKESSESENTGYGQLGKTKIDSSTEESSEGDRFKDIPVAPTLPPLNYEGLPDYIRDAISSSEKPASYEQTDNPYTNPQPNPDDKQVLQNQMEGIFATMRPVEDIPKTYGMNLTSESGHVWNDMVNPPVSHNVGSPRKSVEEHKEQPPAPVSEQPEIQEPEKEPLPNPEVPNQEPETHESEEDKPIQELAEPEKEPEEPFANPSEENHEPPAPENEKPIEEPAEPTRPLEPEAESENPEVQEPGNEEPENPEPVPESGNEEPENPEPVPEPGNEPENPEPVSEPGNEAENPEPEPGNEEPENPEPALEPGNEPENPEPEPGNEEPENPEPAPEPGYEPENPEPVPEPANELENPEPVSEPGNEPENPEPEPGNEEPENPEPAPEPEYEPENPEPALEAVNEPENPEPVPEPGNEVPENPEPVPEPGSEPENPEPVPEPENEEPENPEPVPEPGGEPENPEPVPEPGNEPENPEPVPEPDSEEPENPEPIPEPGNEPENTEPVPEPDSEEPENPEPIPEPENPELVPEPGNEDTEQTSEEPAEESNEEKDKPDIMSKLLKSEQFWKWLGEWTATYMELLEKHIRIIAIQEICNREKSGEQMCLLDDQPENNDDGVIIKDRKIIVDGKEIDITHTDNLDKDLKRGHQNNKGDSDKKNKNENKIEASTIYGNSVGNEKVTNVFIFTTDLADEVIDNLKPADESEVDFLIDDRIKEENKEKSSEDETNQSESLGNNEPNTSEVNEEGVDNEETYEGEVNKEEPNEEGESIKEVIKESDNEELNKNELNEGENDIEELNKDANEPNKEKPASSTEESEREDDSKLEESERELN